MLLSQCLLQVAGRRLSRYPFVKLNGQQVSTVLDANNWGSVNTDKLVPDKSRSLKGQGWHKRCQGVALTMVSDLAFAASNSNLRVAENHPRLECLAAEAEVRNNSSNR